MQKILTVSLDKELAQKLAHTIFSEYGFECMIVNSISEAEKTLEKGIDFYLTIVNINSFGPNNENVIDFLTNINIPIILLTGGIDDNVWDHIRQRNIIDYIIKKKDMQVVYDVKRIIHRIQNNATMKVIIVDDSKISRMKIKELLHAQRFIVLEAGNGVEALKLLRKNTDVKLMIIDYNMPGMHGFELTTSIREQYSKEEMAIIGISAYGSGIVSAKFLKSGANDFILKPYSNEEFRCRINQNLEMLEYIEIIKETANIDYATDLYNRRYFYEIGKKMFANAERDNFKFATAMIDIDKFKSINDSYGHDVGDKVIEYVAAILKNRFRKADIICRFGGDEFCVIGVNMGKDNAFWIFEEVRKAVNEKKNPAVSHIPVISISIGVTTKIADTFDNTIKQADLLLFKAKKNGRNCVVVD